MKKAKQQDFEEMGSYINFNTDLNAIHVLMLFYLAELYLDSAMKKVFPFRRKQDF